MPGMAGNMESFRSRLKTTGLAVRGRYRPKLAAGLALSALLSLNHATLAADSQSSQPICNTDRCGLLIDGAYPHLVIGRLAHIGTPTDTNQVFHWAKTHGYWKGLPVSVTPYLHDVQLVTIAVSDGAASRPVTLFMLRTEFTAAPLHVGDLVRYAPHDAAHDELARGGPADLALFHGLTGCVAALCQKGDGACFARYRQGAFTASQGRQVSLITGHPLSSGAKIDPVSLLPIH